MTEIKNPVPNQVSIRFSDAERDFINENLYLLRKDDEEMPRSKIFMNAVVAAVSNLKPKEIIKDSPETIALVEELKGKVDKLTADNEILVNKLSKSKEIEGKIVIDLPENYKTYFWGILEISKRNGYANSYSELIQKMLYAFQKRNEFVLDENDINYLNELKNKENHG